MTVFVHVEKRPVCTLLTDSPFQPPAGIKRPIFERIGFCATSHLLTFLCASAANPLFVALLFAIFTIVRFSPVSLINSVSPPRLSSKLKLPSRTKR